MRSRRRAFQVCFESGQGGAEPALVFVVHEGDGAEKLVGDIGEDGGAARRDAILAEQEKQAGQEFVDRLGGGEFGEAGSEVGARIGVIRIGLILRQVGVAGTELRTFVGDWETAALAAGKGMAAARRVTVQADVSVL